MISIATEANRWDVLRMAKAFHENSPYRDDEFDLDKCQALFSSWISSDPKTRIILVANDPEPVGCVIALAEEMLFNSRKISAEVVFWVDPAHRGKHGLELIEAYEYWAKFVAGCHRIQAVALEDDSAKIMDRYYRKRGYRKTENAYIKEIQWQQSPV